MSCYKLFSRDNLDNSLVFQLSAHSVIQSLMNPLNASHPVSTLSNNDGGEMVRKARPPLASSSHTEHLYPRSREGRKSCATGALRSLLTVSDWVEKIQTKQMLHPGEATVLTPLYPQHLQKHHLRKISQLT